jgi:hypothetical protein
MNKETEQLSLPPALCQKPERLKHVCGGIESCTVFESLIRKHHGKIIVRVLKGNTVTGTWNTVTGTWNVGMAEMWIEDSTAPPSALLAPADLHHITAHVWLRNLRRQWQQTGKITQFGASLFIHQAKYYYGNSNQGGWNVLGGGGVACVGILAENLLKRTYFILIIYVTQIRLAVCYIRNYFSPKIPHNWCPVLNICVVAVNWRVLFKSILKHVIGRCGLGSSGSGKGPLVGLFWVQ